MGGEETGCRSPSPSSSGPPRSYNPFEGPNENPEAELPLTAGEYIYIYGSMDEDGFFEGRRERGPSHPFVCFEASLPKALHPCAPSEPAVTSQTWLKGKERPGGPWGKGEKGVREQLV